MDRAQLREHIYAAFEGTHRPAENLIALHDCEECAELRMAFAQQEWATMPTELIESHDNSLPLRVTPTPPSTRSVVAGLAAPVLLLHGTADPIVPVEQSRDYEHAARELGKSVTGCTSRASATW